MKAAVKHDKRAGRAMVVASLVAMSATSCSAVTPTMQPVPDAMARQSSATTMAGQIHVGENPSWMKLMRDRDPAAGYTYVGQFWAKAVLAYRTNDRHNDGPVCEIPLEDYALGISTDRSGRIYVTGDFKNVHGQQISGVGVFGPDCGAPESTFDDPYGNPEDPVADGNTLYISTLNDVSIPGSVAVYNLKGGSNPVTQLTDPTAGVGFGVAVDSHHNLFWSNTDWWTGGGQVTEFRKGKMPGVVLKATKIGSDEPGGVILDKYSNLLLIDQNIGVINIYAPPYKAPAFSTITMKGSAWYCAMGVDQTRLYCLDDTYGSVDAYTYPGGKYLFSYNNGIELKDGPVGIAIAPPTRRNAGK